ncbi:very short patch repair endonuclease [Qipengyuania psychrotolerans]|uniref:Very short patch repair endonuclease n=1 Tax=Qipengyuania psychrotolerans TaxID=2867238 RepID=A0ABX8ZGR8_9SPHN|nr:DNA mismatch endonuclease Vsr [Qipengyuania psychrotolerans]QZD86722.1 DNA mismatch endonuclease Vsr [Qipengyuania psychrotolerans]
MADFVSREKRSRIMKGVKQKDTKPEIAVRKLLHSLGLRFRLHRKDLPGRPDLVLARHKTAIFVHGCFWHQHDACKEGRIPSSNREYWEPKLTRNVERDRQSIEALESLGWTVRVIWACELNGMGDLREKLRDWFSLKA